MLNRKDLRFVSYAMGLIFIFFLLAAVMVVNQGCAITKTIDYRTLDTPIKRYHYAQISFKEKQEDYIAMFGRQTETMKAYLRENVSPVMNKAKLALDAWGEAVKGLKPDTGQESAFSKLIDELAILLKPYIVKEE